MFFCPLESWQGLFDSMRDRLRKNAPMSFSSNNVFKVCGVFSNTFQVWEAINAMVVAYFVLSNCPNYPTTPTNNLKVFVHVSEWKWFYLHCSSIFTTIKFSHRFLYILKVIYLSSSFSFITSPHPSHCPHFFAFLLYSTYYIFSRGTTPPLPKQSLSILMTSAVHLCYIEVFLFFMFLYMCVCLSRHKLFTNTFIIACLVLRQSISLWKWDSGTVKNFERHGNTTWDSCYNHLSLLYQPAPK